MHGFDLELMTALKTINYFCPLKLSLASQLFKHLHHEDAEAYRKPLDFWKENSYIKI